MFGSHNKSTYSKNEIGIFYTDIEQIKYKKIISFSNLFEFAYLNKNKILMPIFIFFGY